MGARCVVNSQKAPVYRAPSQLLVGVGAAVLNEIDSTVPNHNGLSRVGQQKKI